MTRFASPTVAAARLACVGLLVCLSACTVFDSEKINYKSAKRAAPTLEVPPDLTQLSRDSRYVVPTGGTVSAAGYNAAQAVAAPTAEAAPAVLGDVRIERDGNTRWLVIKRPADKLWDPVRDFWVESGFLLTIDQSNLGIMETDWAENRAKLPQDFIRQTLGKLIDSAYSTSERDKFRTRMERRADGSTEIYISHRGMQEVYVEKAQQAQTVWQPRPSDPELEAEMLRRMMVKLGAANEVQSKQLIAAAPVQPSGAQVTNVGGTPVVQLNEPFDRAWRRVGLTLDRTGFTVEDRDRSQGIYFVRYVAPNADRKEQSFLGKIFNRNPDAQPPVRYRIAVRAENAGTVVSVLGEGGSPAQATDAERITKIIADDLK
ncbi:outer membrane protein assembly factor BamC [Xylophilus sp. GOD-11R]|uniref:outer membrane protein assembly factor BamC n=1 Tax=Xylophilus sp. GOD-11R TaxID=3089814 RepID=UPI00298D50D6|nr:outer membrane protein assembly factor BamC [Xylophilus sp. GOD-11R]WPB58189.1 outer membrane protein assembly factor BamC [Xylophilus sp. GOD-11R]